jgi:quercetin dioxygenase-like cupin family protein
VLEAPLAGFFRDAGSAVSDFTHVRSGEGLKSVRLMGQHMHAFTALGIHHRQDISFEAILVTIERNEKASPPTYAGHGCVFVYVLEGAAIYRYGQREIRLSEGDSISLDAELRYGVQEVLTPRLRFLSVQAERR